MPALLTDAWFEAVAGVVAAAPAPAPAAGAGVTVAVAVADAPDGVAGTWWWSTLDGGWAVGPGSRADATVTVTLPWADLQQVVAGDLRLGVGYMQGRIKVDGPTGAVLRVLACADSPRLQDIRRSVGALTD